MHFLRFIGSGGSKAAKIASSNTFFNPFCVRAEHSTYLTAFNSLANFSPCSIDIGFCLFLASFSTVPTSSRKSTCVPTKRNGVFWQWWVISGTHWKSSVYLLSFACPPISLLVPFLLRFQMKMDSQLKNIQEKRLFAGNLADAVCRNPLDLKRLKSGV